MSYPKWIYHKTEAPKVVNSKEGHDQAGKGWEEAPFAQDQEQVPTKEEQTETEVGSTKESDGSADGKVNIEKSVEIPKPKTGKK